MNNYNPLSRAPTGNMSFSKVKNNDEYGNDVKTISAQIRNLCIHEALYIGQLIAFSYVLGIKIPKSVVEDWALS
jgi:hypothetical protein